MGFFGGMSEEGIPRPLPVLQDYWDYLAFGDPLLPGKDYPKSTWEDFKLIHRMFKKWDALRQDAEDVRLDPKEDIADKYIPMPKKKSTGGKKGGRSKSRAETAP